MCALHHAGEPAQKFHTLAEDIAAFIELQYAIPHRLFTSFPLPKLA
jgi:hypothetical protein